MYNYVIIQVQANRMQGVCNLHYKLHILSK